MRARNHRSISYYAIATAVALLPVVPTAASSPEKLPKTGAEAMAYFEANADTWLAGPVDYIILDDERKVFKDLSTTTERADFIAEFWALRDETPKLAGNEFKREFYQRVAKANDRYHDFPRGWKSDRGFIHIVLGRPDYVRPIFGRFDSAVWTYFTVGEEGSKRPFRGIAGRVAIAFVRNPARSSYRIYGGFGGPGFVPLYVRDALHYAKEAAVIRGE